VIPDDDTRDLQRSRSVYRQWFRSRARIEVGPVLLSVLVTYGKQRTFNELFGLLVETTAHFTDVARDDALGKLRARLRAVMPAEADDLYATLSTFVPSLPAFPTRSASPQGPLSPQPRHAGVVSEHRRVAPTNYSDMGSRDSVGAEPDTPAHKETPMAPRRKLSPTDEARLAAEHARLERDLELPAGTISAALDADEAPAVVNADGTPTDATLDFLAMVSAETVAAEPRFCECGCGGSPKGKKARYLPGHDARHHSALKAAAKAAAEAAE
jgi:hypothetical protein